MPKVKNNTQRPIRTSSGTTLVPGQETEVSDADMENRRIKQLVERGDLSHGNSADHRQDGNHRPDKSTTTATPTPTTTTTNTTTTPAPAARPANPQPVTGKNA